MTEFNGAIVNLLSEEIRKVVKEQGVLTRTSLREKVVAEILLNWDTALDILSGGKEIAEDGLRIRRGINLRDPE